MPDKQPILDIASLVFAAVIGIPQTLIALRGRQPRNLRVLAALAGACGLLSGAAAAVHLAGGLPAVRVALLGAGVCAGIGWVAALVSLARHNTTM